MRPVAISLAFLIPAAASSAAVRSASHRTAHTVVSGAPFSESLLPSSSAPAPLPSSTGPLAHLAASPSTTPAPKPTPSAPTADWSSFGYDISWPQCTGSLSGRPRPRGAIAIVGLTGGRPFTINPCLQEQWQWALTREHHSVYVNVAAPTDGSNPFLYGQRLVRRAMLAAHEHGVKPTSVWLDVENGNYWSSSALGNYEVVLGAISALKSLHVQPGVYTTPNNWSRITGNRRIPVPFWLAVAFEKDMQAGCRRGGIGHRMPDMVQAVLHEDGRFIDWNMMCGRTHRLDFVRALG